jgi:type IV pilus assembly protein PilV
VKPVRGFSIAEVLVALAVLAVMVTLAMALSLHAFAANGEARRAELAALLAADLAERVRAIAGVDWSALPAPSACDSACPPDRLAAAELSAWREMVATALPAGAGELEIGAGDALSVVLSWAERGGERRAFRLEIGR